MASYPHNTASNKVKPWPAYFIVRTSGEVVPLIGVDELPIGIDLVGVPRALDLEDTIGMLNLGIQRSSEAFYRVAEPKEEAVVTADIAKTTKVNEPGAAQSRPARNPQQVLAKLPYRTKPSPTTLRSVVSRPFEETQTCRHWCTYGHCKWGQQCRYRHTMPLTLSGLEGIGLADWPAWFRSLNPGFFVSHSTQLKTHLGRRIKGRICSGRKACRGEGCSDDQTLGTTHVRAERLRNAGKGEGRKEEVAEQVLARLRGEKVKEEMKGQKNQVSGSVIMERASMKDARNWEDESSETDEETREPVVGKEKLLKASLLD
ncbi:hypothetical protein D0Z07_3977 [Hyphodiscus hymeniophilus]|uniref:C3H1-type domain-containing protein n=1 Tax=Hyphodiscus hymeniophilus TaxID=353542 RepID=A0A9P6VLW7_9HELO|nr:hypothetical protein D0Z07_3977 [Hyphodiscus hymeniophilus]